MRFIDEATVHVSAGAGGNGCIAFRREAHVPRGGPSGGDGGGGGSVIVMADGQLHSLRDYKYKQHYKAQRGEDGRGRDQHGKGAEDIILPVPVGTVVYDADTDELLEDLCEPGQKLQVVVGGVGGLGNKNFATPWNQAPRQQTDGTPGTARRIRLELKSIADVGIIGLPSVGKSTLISVISSARPKIAEYPFTTLTPNLGVVYLDSERELVVADVPGLIEGAADGAGLGHQFLRHIERSGVLVHVVEFAPWVVERDPITDFDIINSELAKHSEVVAEKPQIVVMNKCDITEVKEALPIWKEAFQQRGVQLHTISAVSREGIPEFLEAVWQLKQNSSSGNL